MAQKPQGLKEAPVSVSGAMSRNGVLFLGESWGMEAFEQELRCAFLISPY